MLRPIVGLILCLWGLLSPIVLVIIRPTWWWYPIVVVMPCLMLGLWMVIPPDGIPLSMFVTREKKEE